MFVLVTTPIRSFHFDLHNIELVLLFSDAMKIATFLSTFLSLGWSDSWMHAASLSSLWKPSLPLVYIHGRNFWDQCRFAVTEWSEWVMAEIPRVQCAFLCMTCAWHVHDMCLVSTGLGPCSGEAKQSGSNSTSRRGWQGGRCDRQNCPK